MTEVQVLKLLAYFCLVLLSPLLYTCNSLVSMMSHVSGLEVYELELLKGQTSAPALLLSHHGYKNSPIAPPYDL